MFKYSFDRFHDFYLDGRGIGMGEKTALVLDNPLRRVAPKLQNQ